MASDWSFYGTTAISTFFGEASATLPNGSILNANLQSDSLLGAVVKINDKISGQFEYGLTAGADSAGNTAMFPMLRIFSADYNFGLGTLTIGQNYGPANFFISNQAFYDDILMLPYGGIYTGRNPMLQISMFGAKVAMLKPISPYYYTSSLSDKAQFQASYGINLAGNNISFMGACANNVVGYMVGLGIQLAPIMKNLTLAADVYLAKNPDNVGIANIASLVGDDANNITNTATGALAVANYKLSDIISIEGGFGYYKNNNNIAYTANYIQIPITLDKNVNIVPEAGCFLDKVYYGAKWQINF
jgi:hypothetical protein